MRNSSTRFAGVTLSVLAAAALMTACNRADDGRTAGQKVDSAVATTERKANEMRSDARGTGTDAKNTAGQAMDTVANKAKDMGITTEVNAKLAADSNLSAMRINVDTSNGQVVLNGTAPDSAARDRATTLVKAIDGVQNVDNRLTIEARK